MSVDASFGIAPPLLGLFLLQECQDSDPGSLGLIEHCLVNSGFPLNVHAICGKATYNWIAAVIRAAVAASAILNVCFTRAESRPYKPIGHPRILRSGLVLATAGA